MLGDGVMKMEKMKIDMALEIERMRMESVMKRNQLILESQKQIVDAFVKGLIETRKRPRGETVADSYFSALVFVHGEDTSSSQLIKALFKVLVGLLVASYICIKLSFNVTSLFHK
ncbi:hypothetical protein Tco_0694884 [Tanacetum coccineum]